MNVFKHFRGEIVAMIEAAMAAGELPAGLDLARVAVEPPRDAGHGDLATNAALVLAKPAGLAPRQVAERLLPRLATLAMVDEVGTAGPGFVNLRLNDDFWRQRLVDILVAGTDYGASNEGAGR